MRLLILVAVVAVAAWLFLGHRTGTEAVEAARRDVGAAAEKAKDAVGDLDVESIERELREKGRVVRRRSSQAIRALADATEDVRTTAAIEAQFALDPRLSALDIDVDTTEGRVTLAGRVDSASDLARAIEIAFQHENVREVISTLQILRDHEHRATPPPPR